jgi:RimJ/RimL family protein N-acetyltransferase
MDHCFSDAGFRRLTCGHFIDNPASARVIKKLGFRRTGNGAQWCEARKSEVPTVKYARRRPLLSHLLRSAAR